MSRLPRPRSREVIKALQRAGFQVVRVSGSHHFLRHADGRTTVHTGEVIGPGLLRKVLKDTELTPEQLQALL